MQEPIKIYGVHEISTNSKYCFYTVKFPLFSGEGRQYTQFVSPEVTGRCCSLSIMFGLDNCLSRFSFLTVGEQS